MLETVGGVASIDNEEPETNNTERMLILIIIEPCSKSIDNLLGSIPNCAILCYYCINKGLLCKVASIESNVISVSIVCVIVASTPGSGIFVSTQL